MGRRLGTRLFLAFVPILLVAVGGMAWWSEVMLRDAYLASPPTAGAALPFYSAGAELGTLRGRLWIGLSPWILGALALMLSLSFAIAERLTRPYAELRRRIQGQIDGDLETELRLPEIEEADATAFALTRLGHDFDRRLRDLVRKTTEHDALLGSMAEGVLALDPEGRVLLMNDAAGRFFGVDPIVSQGRFLQEVVRLSALSRFVERTLFSGDAVEEEISLVGEPERYLRAQGAALLDPARRRIGALVVLNDVTHLRRLETHRREFVANVSHELKTPITSIKGFVETLRDGGEHDPADRSRFLEIIARQADRLNTLVEDLLSLSRIELQGERGEAALELRPLRPILEDAAQDVLPLATERSMTIEIDCPAELEARLNETLLEQAVSNLIDNAIKYGDAGTKITVRARSGQADLEISVEDHSPGIEPQHLPRLFERFYRVDRGRSRKLGGTGLGLAIVKHIALAHGGNVSVESFLGRGSMFRIHLPHP